MMGEAERLLRKQGAVQVLGCKKHKVYVLDGIRFSLHQGSACNPAEIRQVRQKLRRMGRLPR